ncbi:MAG: insulinase family protein, partial [Deltaproteobacteria bacterium]|nr:insulinase family protein [Deltaproteobacteria bacterium]
IESVGGVLNAFTGKEYTCFYAKVLNKDIPLAVDVLTDMFLNSAFKASEIEREKLVVCQEIKMVDDTPDDVVHDLFMKGMWGAKGELGTPILGTSKTVSAFTSDAISGYMGRRYQGSNVLITAAGGIKHDKILKLFDKAMKSVAKGDTLSEKPTQRRKPSVMQESFSSVNLIKRDLEQVHMCLGVPAVEQADKDRYKLYLLNTILGSGMSSRLFQEVREKRGLAYSVYSYLNLMRGAGALTVYAGTVKKDFKRVIALVTKELRRMGKDITPKTLKCAKDQLKGGILLGLETSDSRMNKLARDEIYFGKSLSIKEIVSNIDAVTPVQIKNMAKRLFVPSRMTLAAVGRVTKRDLPEWLKRK